MRISSSRRSRKISPEEEIASRILKIEKIKK
jgi:hypothetical protein